MGRILRGRGKLMDTITALQTFSSLASSLVEQLMGYDEYPPPSVDAINEAADVLGMTPREATAHALDQWWMTNHGEFTIDSRRDEILGLLEAVAGRPLALA